MRYISPIRFFNHCNVNINDQTVFNNTSRLKKIVATEFALCLDGIISIDGHDYNKNDVLVEIENPNWVQNIEYHIIVWNNKALLAYLEKNNPDFFFSDIRQINLSRDKDFVNFISPYFAESYNNIMRSFYNPVDFIKANQGLAFIDFINDKYLEKALMSTRNFLIETILLFQNISRDTYTLKIEEMMPWLLGNWANYLNNLPEHFSFYREYIAEILVTFCKTMQSIDANISYTISSNLIQLRNINNEVADRIQECYKLYLEVHQNTQSYINDRLFYTPPKDNKEVGDEESRLTKYYIYVIIIAIIWIIIALLKIKIP